MHFGVDNLVKTGHTGKQILESGNVKRKTFREACVCVASVVEVIILVNKPQA